MKYTVVGFSRSGDGLTKVEAKNLALARKSAKATLTASDIGSVTIYLWDEMRLPIDTLRKCDACQIRTCVDGLPWCRRCARRDSKAREKGNAT